MRLFQTQLNQPCTGVLFGSLVGHLLQPYWPQQSLAVLHVTCVHVMSCDHSFHVLYTVITWMMSYWLLLVHTIVSRFPVLTVASPRLSRMSRPQVTRRPRHCLCCPPEGRGSRCLVVASHKSSHCKPGHNIQNYVTLVNLCISQCLMAITYTITIIVNY